VEWYLGMSQKSTLQHETTHQEGYAPVSISEKYIVDSTSEKYTNQGPKKIEINIK